MVNIEWYQITSFTERNAGIRSQKQIIAICVARNGQPVDASNDDKNQYEGHIISDLSFYMIRQCPEPYNDDFDILGDPVLHTDI